MKDGRTSVLAMKNLRINDILSSRMCETLGVKWKITFEYENMWHTSIYARRWRWVCSDQCKHLICVVECGNIDTSPTRDIRHSDTWICSEKIANSEKISQKCFFWVMADFWRKQTLNDDNSQNNSCVYD